MSSTPVTTDTQVGADPALGLRSGLVVPDSAPESRADWWTLHARVVDYWVLGVALVVGAVLRVVAIGSVGLNSDEAVYSGQAASLAGNESFLANFPIVRAHPLLFHVLISPWYSAGTPDVAGRYVSAAFGVGTIAMVYVLGRLLYGSRTGAIAALLLSLMPYHVLLSRQVLLDGPMTFFTTAAMVCLAMLARTERARWLIATGACLGIAALTKETAAILVMAAFVFLALVPRFWKPLRPVLIAAVVALGLTLVYPLVTTLAGGGSKGQSYLAWQLSRRPNHDLLFYVTVIPVAMGILVVIAAIVGLIVLRKKSSWREALLLTWIAVPFVFFEVWPTKGYPYMVVVAPALVVLAARPLAVLLDQGPARPRAFWGGIGLTAVMAVSLLVPAISAVTVQQTSGLAGGGGTPGGRETGAWIAENLPAGTRLMTIGPSMANVIQYYSGFRSDGLSVSPNPLKRNPSYAPIANPDRALRTGVYRYVVWDVYSAKRSPNFATKELALVRKYGGRAVHTETATIDGKAGQPVAIVYQLKPTSSTATPEAAPAVKQPNRAVIYVAYLAVLLGGIGVVVWAWMGEPDRRRFTRRRDAEPQDLAAAEGES